MVSIVVPTDYLSGATVWYRSPQLYIWLSKFVCLMEAVWFQLSGTLIFSSLSRRNSISEFALNVHGGGTRCGVGQGSSVDSQAKGQALVEVVYTRSCMTLFSAF